MGDNWHQWETIDISGRQSTSVGDKWHQWETSHQHEFDKIISHCHPCDYLFIIYHNTGTNRNFVYTYHSHIYYTSTHCHFLTLQITVCLSCQTQQAMHNVPNLKKKKMSNKKFKKIFKTKFKTKFHTKKILNLFPHKICIVSHSSYHIRRITLPRYFRWKMTNIGAINITLVYDNVKYLIQMFFLQYWKWIISNVFTTLQQRLVKSLIYFWNIAVYSFRTNVAATL